MGNVPALRACQGPSCSPSEPLPASRLPPTDSDPGVAPLRCHVNYRSPRLARHACPGESAPQRKQEGCSKQLANMFADECRVSVARLSSSRTDDLPTTRSTRIYDLQLLPPR